MQVDYHEKVPNELERGLEKAIEPCTNFLYTAASCGRSGSLLPKARLLSLSPARLIICLGSELAKPYDTFIKRHVLSSSRLFSVSRGNLHSQAWYSAFAIAIDADKHFAFDTFTSCYILLFSSLESFF